MARTYGLADRIDELGQDPAQAYDAAKADGITGDAMPPLELGSAAPAPANDEIAGDPAPVDPDSALHHAAPGKPAVAAAKAKPGIAPLAADTGTLADTQGTNAMPSRAPVRPTAAPIEPAASLGDVYSSAKRLQEGDNSFGAENALRKGYVPILTALGLDPSENPANFNDGTGYGNDLLTTIRYGFRNRDQQETRLAQLIRDRQAKDPSFLRGVPVDPTKLRAYALEGEKQQRAEDRATLERSPGGISGFAAQLGGGAVASFEDPVQLSTLPIGGAGKSLVGIAGREFLTQSALEALQLPILAENRAKLGEKLTPGEAAMDVAGAGVGGAVLGPALHVAGHVAGVAIGKVWEKLPESVRGRWAARFAAGGVKTADVMQDMDNREVAEFARSTIGEDKLTPDEKAAASVLEREQEIGETSPYQPGAAGDRNHQAGLAAAVEDLENRRTPNVEALPSGAETAGTGAEPSPAPERPPAALSTARRPQPSEPHSPRFNIDDRPQSESEAIETFTARVGHAENNTGNIHAKNPNSSASGPAQFTDGTFRDYYRKVYGVDPGKHPAADLKDNPAVQSRLLDSLTRDNADALKARGEAVSVGNLYLAHFLGSGDALRVLKADASTPIERVLSEKVLESNDFLRGKSTSEVAAWAAKKMDRSAASVPPRGVAGALDASDGADETLTAQLNADALQLDDQVIGLTQRPDGSRVNLYSRRVPVSDLNVDAERFQFKDGGDQFGVTDRLRGVEEVDPLQLGRLTAWEDRNGKLWVSDGHQRTGLLKREAARTGENRLVDVGTLREADGVTAEDAMVMAALKNLGEDSGTKIDAAKIGRANADALERAARRLPKSSALIRDGKALARLSDEAFGAVINDVVPADYAAVIGHLLPDRPEAHAAMIELLAKMDPANRGQAESIVRQGMAAGLHKEEQVDLFGAHSHVTSLMMERAKVLEKVLAKLRKLGLVHKTAAKEADTLEAVGSKIAKSASEKEAQANEQALEIVSRLAFSRGAVADALNDAAAKLAAGGKLADVADDAARAIRRLDIGTLARETAVDDSSRLAVDGAGRGGDAAEEGPQPPSQSGDQEQPSLIELEHATERFSDPDGPAVKQQAESLTHDLKAEVEPQLERREKIKAATAELEKAAPGELRTTEPFPEEEPGYHRFRYVAEDGTAVGGNYTVDGDTIEGFNIGDVNNRAELGPAQVRKIFDQLHAQHPEVEYVHAYRKSGARAGEQEVWFQFTDKGVKYHGDTDPRAIDHAAAFMADVNENSFPGREQIRAEIEAEDPAYLDQVDAEDIMGHALDNLSMKQGRLLTYGKGEAAVQKELEKHLKDTNNVDAGLKHVEKAIESGRLQVKDHGEAPLEEPMHIGPSELIPAPERTVKAAELAGGKTITPEEAKAKLEGWKAEAQRIGRESPPPPNHVILSLFDASGVFSQPYRDMGYGVIQLDIKHGHDLMEDISIIQHAIDDAKARGAHFAGVIAQPPCTTFAASGARWWDPRHNRSNFAAVRQMFGPFAAKEFRSPLEYNQMLVMVTQEFIARANPDFFAIENPVGRIEKMTGLPKPQLAFDPSNFGDPYTKRTHLWGKFNPELETANVEPTEGSKMHKLRGRDEKDDGLRSVTSEPFAYAFALANRPGTEERAAAASTEGMLHGATSAPAADAGGNPLDLGPKEDPAIAETNKQLAQLGAEAPLRAPSDVAQRGEIGLPLMDAHDQPTFRLSEEGEPISAADLLADLDDDDKALKALKDCL